jgi:hypothetical protein
MLSLAKVKFCRIISTVNRYKLCSIVAARVSTSECLQPARQRVTDMLPISLCKKKTCNSTHEQTPFSKDTIYSVLRIRELGRAKDLSAPPRIGGWVGTRVGLDGCKISRPNGIWSPDRQPRSKSLYQLIYPVPIHPSLYKRNLSLAESKAQPVTVQVQVYWDMCWPGAVHWSFVIESGRAVLKAQEKGNIRLR